jgi:hypothetical protein
MAPAGALYASAQDNEIVVKQTMKPNYCTKLKNASFMTIMRCYRLVSQAAEQ